MVPRWSSCTAGASAASTRGRPSSSWPRAGASSCRGDPAALAHWAARLPTLRWPWEARTPVEALVAAGFPVLVVSGGQRPMYEEISDGLAAALGAERRVVPASHAVQATGAPFNAVLEELLVRAEAAAVASGRAGAGRGERPRAGTAA